MDFTITTYKKLMKDLLNAGFSFQSFEQYLFSPKGKVIILRHDVDLLPHNSLLTAQIEHELGIVGTYYFRIVKESNHPEIIKQIADLGHEIGYHYETMDTASKKVKVKRLKGRVECERGRGGEQEMEELIDDAYEEFCKNLEYFRTLYPVKTICMHGSPLSKYDNMDIWTKYDYKKLGIIGEPYFDIDFSKVLYITDTGRRWDGDKVSVRDRVKRDEKRDMRDERGEESSVNVRKHYHSTNDIIKAIDEGSLPDQIMITVHPQRWNDSIIPWTKELVAQNLKNLAKRVLIKYRG